MEQEILKDWQKKVVDFIASSEKMGDFYLTGGTALAAFYLKHRLSDDLDFFSPDEVDQIFIHSIARDLKDLIGSSKMRFNHIYDRNQFFYKVDGGEEEYKIEFTKYPFKQLQPVKILKDLKIDSEFDIAVNKLLTIMDRFDPKDFVDLYFLLPKYSSDILKMGVEEKFGHKISFLSLGSDLSKARNIVALPKMIKPLTVDELKRFFSEEAKKLEPEVIEE